MSEKADKGGSSRKGGRRNLRERVKTARGRKLSSKLWLERQLNDPYVTRAKEEGYRSRAAFKLTEMDDKFHFLKKGGRIVDLGAAPGGWTQVSVARTGSDKGPSGTRGKVVGIDLQEVDAIPGADLYVLDFLEDDADTKVKQWLGGEADVVLSDMAAASMGHKQTDHLRIMALAEAAAQFAHDVLCVGGTYCAKVLQGGAEQELLGMLKRDFKTVRHVKPAASRADSSEMYVLATGFKGRQEEDDDEV
ncbi:RlmE family RNA methyltransferase [Parvibaculaceae bacterium PLY_AMNH_Bact1]|nr:RlmE family RNA methyltransferase [Parvibaculaceae bacterium PLY_AMNH_Bact1]